MANIGALSFPKVIDVCLHRDLLTCDTFDAFLEKVKEETGAKYIALAHHGNDRAETFLFHLCRGIGVKGLFAIVLQI